MNAVMLYAEDEVVNGARMVREAMAAVHARLSSQQLGECFEGLMIHHRPFEELIAKARNGEVICDIGQVDKATARKLDKLVPGLRSPSCCS